MELTFLQSVIYHDVVTRNVWVSQDEGKTWQRASGVPDGDAMMVIEHPFDNRFVSHSFRPLVVARIYS